MVRRLSRRTPNSLPSRVCAAAAAVMIATLAVACSSRDKQAGTDSASMGAAASTPGASAAPGTARGTVHLEVIGGPNAGSYDAQMTDGGCSYGLAGAGAWGNQYSADTTDPKAFSSLQLIVPDAKAAAKGTSTFHVTAGFGPLFGSGATKYDVDTQSSAGGKSESGRVTVDDRGTSGRVTFDAKTGAGVELKGTIDCATVMRAA